MPNKLDAALCSPSWDKGRTQGSPLQEHRLFMDSFKQMLTGGDRRSLGLTEKTVELVLAESERLPELYECLFDQDEIVRMRAGDALEKICRQKPEWFIPYTERLFTEVANIQQPSVQWHLAQMLSEIPLGIEERGRAIALLKHNLTHSQDWIVINLTLEALSKFASEDEALRHELPVILNQYKNSPYKSVASRVRKLLKIWGTD